MDLDATRATLAAVFAGHPEVRFALLFGSVARGEARPDSDVDVAVAGEADVLALMAEISLALGREAHVVPVETASIPLNDELLRDGLVVHDSPRGDAADWRARTLATQELDRPAYRLMVGAFVAKLARSGGAAW